MLAYVIYNPETGAVLRSIISSHDGVLDITANTPEGMAALEVAADSPSLLDQSGWQVVNGALVAKVPSDAELLAAAQTAQSAVMETAYTSAINNGFTSSALGASHLYPSSPVDQANLTAVVAASIIPTQPANWTTLFWCAPANTSANWDYLAHTAAQIQQVGLDAMSYIMAAKMRRATRLGQIQAATTVTAVQAIVW